MSKWIIGFVLLLCSLPSYAQVYTVTGQAIDSDGQQWIGGSYQVTLVRPGGLTNYYCTSTGTNFPASFGGTLDSTGSFSLQLTSTGCIVPKGSLWQFTICPNVTAAACGVIQVPITSAQSVSAAINAVILAPRVTGGPGIYAYSDIEVSAFAPNTYFNVISQTNRCYSTGWGLCTGNDTIPAATAAGQGPKSSGPGQNYFASDLAAPVLNASAADVTGADIGAKVNTLFTRLSNASQNGTVTLDPTAANGTQTTTIRIPLGDTLNCQGATLNWPATGNQVVYGGTFVGGTQAQQGSILNCTMIGTNQTATAIYAGGDPAGVISPSGNFGNNLTLSNDVIEGYQIGFTHGSNSYNNLIFGTNFLNNYDDIASSPTNALNDGEATMITGGSVISNATHCGLDMNNPSDVYIISNTHLDYNAGGAVCGSAATVQLQNDWEEQYFGPFINLTGISTTSNYVTIQSGQGVTTAVAATITNVTIDGANNLTLATTGPNTGYLVGKTLNFSGLTTATFLNGTSGVIESSGSTGVVLSYTHGTYASAPDTGLATPANADLWHVEGLNSYVNIDNVTLHMAYPAAVTAWIGLGSANTTTVCASRMINANGPVAFTGNIGLPCQWNSILDIAIGSSAAKISPSNFYTTTTQGFNIAWSVELANGATSTGGDLDFINIHGTGAGGFAFCDGAFSYTPTATTCQFSISGTGDNYALGNDHAPQFYYPTVTTGPNQQEFNDCYGTTGWGSGAIGSPTAASFGVNNGVSDVNHPGNCELISGTVTGTGEYATGESSGGQVAINLNASPAWTFDTIVYVPVLPATTAAAYEVGLYHNPGTVQNSGGGQGFFLSSNNSVKNDWYCSYGANVNTDSGVAATVAWTHLSMVMNGTSLIWYVNGVQVCTTAASNVTSISSYTNWKAETLTVSTAVDLYIDEYTFQRALTR